MLKYNIYKFYYYIINNKTILSYLTFIFCFFIVLLLSFCDPKTEEVKKEVAKPVKTMTLDTPEEIEIKKYPGKVEANEDAVLSFQVSGNLIEFPIEKGQDVVKGDLIAKIDPIDYKLKYNEAKSIFDERELSLGRTAALLKKGYAPQAQYDKEKASYDVAKASLDLAIQDLLYTELKAPFEGRIADTFVENNQNVKEKEPIALLHNKNDIDIAIDVPESVMINIKDKNVLERTAIFDSAQDKKYKIEFKDVVLLADHKTQTYKVYMTMPTPKDINILPGMTATVIIKILKDKASDNNTSENSESFLVPATSVFTDENKKNYVWKINSESKRITQVPVTTGVLKNDMIQVTSGLKTGDQIVTAGVHLLRENQLVSPYK